MSPVGNIASAGNTLSTGHMSSVKNILTANPTSPSIGDAVTSGIQDISALVTLLGSSQCEEHVSSSLVGGFLYTSASSLSIFGSLGIVSAGLKALVASLAISSIGKEGMGAKKLNDMGLSPTGKALSQIMWRGNCHIGQTKLDKTLEELDIRDPTDMKKLTVDVVRWRWNLWMLITSAVAVVLSITPYVYLTITYTNHRMLLRWFFPIFYPLSRSIGSLVVSNTIQIIIQMRLSEIIGHRLTFLTLYNDVRDRKFEGSSKWWDARFSSEVALSHLKSHLEHSQAPPPESLPESPPNSRLIYRFIPGLKPGLKKLVGKNHSLSVSSEEYAENMRMLKTLQDAKTLYCPTATHRVTLLLGAQILTTFGLLLTVVGYIGCFDIVQSNQTEFGPLSWLLVEIGLSVVRMVIWGWNPSWDEKTYLVFSLAPAQRSPSSTCDKFYEDLEAEKKIPLTSALKFLRDIRSYVGLLEPVKVLDGNLDLYYTMSRRRSDGNRVLYVTIVDHNLNVSWTVVYSEWSDELLSRREAQISSNGVATLTDSPTDSGRTSVDQSTFIEDLKAHCHTVLRKLRLHTFVDALAQGLLEVLSDNGQQEPQKALMDETWGSGGLEATLLEPRLLNLLAVLQWQGQAQGQVSPHLYAEVLSQLQVLKQGQSWERAVREAKHTLRKALSLHLGQDPRDFPVEEELAEVVVLGLVLVQRQGQQQGKQGIGRLAEVVTEVVALGQDLHGYEYLDRALTLVLVLKLGDNHTWERAWKRMRMLMMQAGVRDVANVVKALGRMLAWAQAEQVQRSETQIKTQARDRPPLNIRLTWALQPIEEIEQVSENGRSDRDRNDTRPLTDDDLGDMAYLKARELESPKERFCLKRSEQIEELGVPRLVEDTLAKLPRITKALLRREEHLRWAGDGVSGATIVEILILDVLYQLERLLVEESSRLEDVLRWRSMEMVAVLEQRRGRDGEDAAQKITNDHKVNAKRRVVEEAARVQRRLERLGEEAQARFKRGGHSGQMEAFLENQWQGLREAIAKAWIRLETNIERGTEAHIEARIYTPNTLCKLVQSQKRAQMKAWLEGEREMMENRVWRAQSGFSEFVDKSGNYRTTVFLNHLLFVKNWQLVQLPSNQEENDLVPIVSTLRSNPAISCVDCTACALDEVISIIGSSWKAKGITVILSTEVLGSAELETALRDKNKNILSLNSSEVSDTLKRVIQANRTAAEHALLHGDDDGPLTYYEGIEMSDDCAYLVFKQPGQSRCTISFLIPSGGLVQRAVAGQLLLRLVHRRTGSNATITIRLNSDTDELPIDQANYPQDDFGVQDTVLPIDGLLPGLNTLTITLGGRTGEGENQHVYQMREAQLVWPPAISEKTKLVQLDSDVVWGSAVDTIPNILGLSTIVSCRYHTLDQVTEIMGFLWEMKSVTLLLSLAFDNLAEADIARLQTVLWKYRNILSLNSDMEFTRRFPKVLKLAIQANRTAAEDALKAGDKSGPLVYYDDTNMDVDSTYMEFQWPNHSRCTIIFSVLVKETTHGVVPEQLILRLDHWRRDSDAEIDIRLNGTNEVPWEQDNCPQSDFGVQDVVLPSTMYSPGVNRLTITLTRCFLSEYRIKDVRLVWMNGGQKLGREAEHTSQKTIEPEGMVESQETVASDAGDWEMTGWAQ